MIIFHCRTKPQNENEEKDESSASEESGEQDVETLSTASTIPLEVKNASDCN